MRVNAAIKVNMRTIREAGEKKSEKVACHKMKCVDQLLHLSGPASGPHASREDIARKRLAAVPRGNFEYSNRNLWK